MPGAGGAPGGFISGNGAGAGMGAGMGAEAGGIFCGGGGGAVILGASKAASWDIFGKTIGGGAGFSAGFGAGMPVIFSKSPFIVLMTIFSSCCGIGSRDFEF